MLAADTDPLTQHDIASEATWADRCRDANHRKDNYDATKRWRPSELLSCWGGPGRGADLGWRLNRRIGCNSRRTFAFCLSKRMKARIGQHFETDGPPIVRFLQKLLLVAQKRTHFDGRHRSWSDDDTQGDDTQG